MWKEWRKFCRAITDEHSTAPRLRAPRGLISKDWGETTPARAHLDYKSWGFVGTISEFGFRRGDPWLTYISSLITLRTLAAHWTRGIPWRRWACLPTGCLCSLAMCSSNKSLLFCLLAAESQLLAVKAGSPEKATHIKATPHTKFGLYSFHLPLPGIVVWFNCHWYGVCYFFIWLIKRYYPACYWPVKLL